MGRQPSRKDIMRFRFAGVLIVAALVTVSCGGVVDPSQNVTTEFKGTLEPYPSANSSKLFTFTTSKSGEFSVKITTLAPNTNVFLDTLYGQAVAADSCSPLQDNQFSVLNQTSLSGAITPGTWCVVIRDIGTLKANEDFTLAVAHP
jgi:hypothetical protein